jgi:hypothetical protein
MKCTHGNGPGGEARGFFPFNAWEKYYFRKDFHFHCRIIVTELKGLKNMKERRKKR